LGCEAGLRLNLLFAICYLLLLTFVCFVPFGVSRPGFPPHSTSLRAGSAGMTKPGSVLLCRNNWKFFPDNLEMVMQVRVAQRVRPRAEAQRRWDGKGVAVLLFSASQRLCARTYWFRPQAALGASAFICGSGVLARGLRTHPTVANRGFGLGVDSDGVVGVLVRW